MSKDAEITEISVDALTTHPKNPRISLRQDVIAGIVAGLGGGFHPAHALQVWQNGDDYVILSGHHRAEAARQAGIGKVPCWVRQDLTEDQAYMILATDNNQGELSPLEIGIHALSYVPKSTGGRGKKGGLSEYAKALGKNQATISQLVQAARVAEKVLLEQCLLQDKTKHLSAIHQLPTS